MRAIFGKPSPTNESAQSEYDKFIIQPLRMLYYAKILDSRKDGSKYYYSVKNWIYWNLSQSKKETPIYFLHII